MEFLFFDAAGARLFARSDAESAAWTVEEMSLQALFPYDPDKVIRRGQRIGFTDEAGVLQPFEVRRVRTYEPDHYQEITAEHIAVSELSDEHLDQTELSTESGGSIAGITAAAALAQILTGTLWSVGTSTASGTQIADVSRGSVWQGVRVIEENWNVYITPRVTFNAAGITGRYLDIAPAGPTWRGVRLSLDKNADEVGVTWDDTNVITAIYGYGGRVPDASGDDTEILTFADAVWSATSSHPAKPAGQTWLEDPDAKALYGRNGRNRFGYYQNSDIDDAETLLEKAWEALKNSNAPEVSVDCQVRDLYRLGYADQPIRLHDEAIIDVRPTGEVLRREIIRLTVDLLDPTATRATIGAYVPNIVYMQRETDKASRGGGGGGGRGGGGGGGGEDNQFYEFTTSIQANRYQIHLNATHWADTDSILTQAGMLLDADGVLIYSEDNANMVGSKLKVQADKIALVVNGNNQIRAAQITAAINGAGSLVHIDADRIRLSGGQTTVESLLSGAARVTSFQVRNFDQSSGGTLTLKGRNANWSSITYVTSANITLPSTSLTNQYYFVYGSASDPQGAVQGRLVSSHSGGSVSVSTDTKYFLVQEAE